MVGAALLAVAGGCASGNNETPASADPIEIALIRVEPTDGESDVARNRVVRITFNTAVLPESVTDQSILIRTGGTFQTRPVGTFLILGNVVEFDPTVTSTGGANASGFPAGAQIVVEVPLKIPGDNVPANLFVQNVEGNPITVASGDNILSFTTGCEWNDPTPGPPGALGLEFTPGASSPGGPIPADAAVTIFFNEPIDPESFLLGKNVFLTNNTDTSPDFQQDIPSRVFVDGSLTRYTLKPVAGFGQGPFSMAVNFIDPDDPGSFDPVNLPRDLGGAQVQNFTFIDRFDTEFDDDVEDIRTIREDFRTSTQEDTNNTTGFWGNDPEFPFTAVGATITTRTQNVNISAILANGGINELPDVGGGPMDEGRYCAPSNPLVGPDILLPIADPPTSAGRRTLTVYRAGELGGAGTIIRAAWGPLNDTTTASTYNRVVIRIGHKRPNTNVTAGSFFAEFDVDGFTLMTDRPYSVPQSTDINNNGVNDDGYLDWPAFNTFFGYDGVNDLVVDIDATEGTASQFFRVFYAVTAVSAACTCAQLFNATGACALNDSIGLRTKDSVFGFDFPVPTQVVLGIPNPAPITYVMQFEMANLVSKVTSLYYDSGVDAPDYLEPIVGPLIQPCGAAISLRFSGSQDGVLIDVPFTDDINAVDGFRFIAFEITLNSNFFTRSRGRVDILDIPFLVESS